MKKHFTLFLLTFLSSNVFAQQPETVVQINNFLDDTTLYTDRFVAVSTDAAIYISNSNWMTTAKKRKLYSVSLSVHSNLFFVPKSDRTFDINNSDFKFFKIKDKAGNTINETVAVPSVFGGSSSYYLTGQISTSPIKMSVPDGVSREMVPYPFAQVSVSLWKGFELMGKFAPKVTYDLVEYKISGIGVKHNFSQYFKSLEKKKINLSGIVSYATESISTRFITTTTDFGTMGMDQLTSYIKTWNYQVGVSKEWKNFELILSSINSSNRFEYELTGPRGTIEDTFPNLRVQQMFNDKLKNIYKTTFNSMLEVSGRYQYKKIYFQSSVSFGKFLNSSFSAQYEF